MRLFIRLLSISCFGQISIIALHSALNKFASNKNDLRILLVWMIIFAAFNAAVLVVMPGFASKSGFRRRFLGLTLAASLSLFAYGAALTLTGGYIMNLHTPLLLMFLAGSIPPFVFVLWPRSLRAVA
jgi:hypothetical protein